MARIADELVGSMQGLTPSRHQTSFFEANWRLLSGVLMALFLYVVWREKKKRDAEAQKKSTVVR
jgi:hypothetical protein